MKSNKALSKHVVHLQTKRAEKYLIKAASKNTVSKYRILNIGDQVLINTDSTRVSKKKSMGKGYFPFSGTIVDKIKTKFQIRWGLAPGMGKKSGSVCKKLFHQDQLLLCTNENQELTVQLFQNADSWNSYEVELSTTKVQAVFRERKTSKGYLEVLCLLENKPIPVWKSIPCVGDCIPCVTYFKQKVMICFVFKKKMILNLILVCSLEERSSLQN
jgi:hypothetical protein